MLGQEQREPQLQMVCSADLRTSSGLLLGAAARGHKYGVTEIRPGRVMLTVRYRNTVVISEFRTRGLACVQGVGV